MAGTTVLVISTLFMDIFMSMHEKLLVSLSLRQPVLTLTVLVATIDAQWGGLGDVGSARYEPALLPPCPTIRVLRYSTVTSEFSEIQHFKG